MSVDSLLKTDIAKQKPLGFYSAEGFQKEGIMNHYG